MDHRRLYGDHAAASFHFKTFNYITRYVCNDGRSGTIISIAANMSTLMRVMCEFRAHTLPCYSSTPFRHPPSKRVCWRAFSLFMAYGTLNCPLRPLRPRATKNYDPVQVRGKMTDPIMRGITTHQVLAPFPMHRIRYGVESHGNQPCCTEVCTHKVMGQVSVVLCAASQAPASIFSFFSVRLAWLRRSQCLT